MLKSMILKFIYPDRCAVCGEILPFGAKGYVCKTCSEADLINTGVKYVLKKNLSGGNDVYYESENVPVYFYEGLSVFPYKIVKGSIHILKYYGGRINVKPYSEILLDYIKLRGSEILKKSDIVTYVPMYHHKERERGYNQAKLLALEFSKLINKPCEKLLVKVFANESQSKLTAEERVKNVKGAYAPAKKCSLNGKTILIVDDVFTTGSTLNECSKILLEMGAEKVYFLTFAYAN